MSRQSEDSFFEKHASQHSLVLSFIEYVAYASMVKIARQVTSAAFAIRVTSSPAVEISMRISESFL